MDVNQQVRLAIYQMTISDGRVPSVEELAGARGLGVGEVRSAYLALAEGHVIVLKPGSTDVWSAPPFSAVPTAFRVRPAETFKGQDRRSWYAPCAWDAFGIPALLKQDVIIDACCAESGALLPCAVRAARADGSGIIHLEVPARHFWDDIFYT